jgi:hypothetical protein
MRTWSHEFVLAAREREAGRLPELLAAVRSGSLVPVSRGVYRHAAARPSDPSLRDDDDYRASIRAAQLRAPHPLVISGISAAAIWRLPVVGAWPDRVAISAPREAGGRSNAHLTRSYIGFPPPTQELDGLVVTTLARTVADVARSEPMERSIPMLDAALRGYAGSGAPARRPVSTTAVHRELTRLGRVPGAVRARGAIEFASGSAGSAGESCSRVGMWRLGMPPPVLQHAFRDSRGLIGYTDFFWPQLGIVGEFDGRGKYLREEFAQGRSVAEVVMDEKAREDRLRALGLRVVRWGWAEARDLRALERRLRAAGVS